MGNGAALVVGVLGDIARRREEAARRRESLTGGGIGSLGAGLVHGLDRRYRSDARSASLDDLKRQNDADAAAGASWAAHLADDSDPTPGLGAAPPADPSGMATADQEFGGSSSAAPSYAASFDGPRAAPVAPSATAPQVSSPASRRPVPQMLPRLRAVANLPDEDQEWGMRAAGLSYEDAQKSDAQVRQESIADAMWKLGGFAGKRPAEYGPQQVGEHGATVFGQEQWAHKLSTESQRVAREQRRDAEGDQRFRIESAQRDRELGIREEAGKASAANDAAGLRQRADEFGQRMALDRDQLEETRQHNVAGEDAARANNASLAASRGMTLEYRRWQMAQGDPSARSALLEKAKQAAGLARDEVRVLRQSSAKIFDAAGREASNAAIADAMRRFDAAQQMFDQVAGPHSDASHTTDEPSPSGTPSAGDDEPTQDDLDFEASRGNRWDPSTKRFIPR